MTIDKVFWFHFWKISVGEQCSTSTSNTNRITIRTVFSPELYCPGMTSSYLMQLVIILSLKPWKKSGHNSFRNFKLPITHVMESNHGETLISININTKNIVFCAKQSCTFTPHSQYHVIHNCFWNSSVFLSDLRKCIANLCSLSKKLYFRFKKCWLCWSYISILKTVLTFLAHNTRR